MIDLAKTIAPKSDQLNADDLIAGPITITITSVRGSDDPDQPVAMHFEGDNRKPYKPCKSMRRVMVHCWGADGTAYAGRRMTLYRDDKVQFGGIQVGGIRISHMSHIDREVTMALTATRAKRTPYTVKPLRAEVRPGPQGVGGQDDDFPGDRPRQNSTSGLTLAQRADAYERRIKDAVSAVKLQAIRAAGEQLRRDLEEGDPDRLVALEELWRDRHQACEAE